MSKLQEMLERKRAAALADKQATEVSTPIVPEKNLSTVVKTEITPVAGDGTVVTKTDVNGTMAVKTLADPVKKEEPAVAAPKAMSFAEKMALKKAEAASHNAQDAGSSDAKPAPTPAKEDTPTPTKVIATVQQAHAREEEILRSGMLDASMDKNPMPPPDVPSKEDAVDPAIAQAYADIKERIQKLNELSETPLEGAMKELKKALMANPAACSLMEDTDIGQMVVALRRITGEAITEASKEKTPGRKKSSAKQVDLSDANAVAQIFDEL